ncbi:GNAT family N-acetyltransferase [Rhodospirillaceae bacterium KN72]|uniref:GNAT family N-acetyltransferase n=1 Tax=Pacificispira spongiicola TaxID=2729598 RepID=A0A7Y0E162_9PROT|nr:GNAT family N-acetyltransferase [Pacificispira spongiicola]NMM45296.1 GNAT family N-acetyltransferase [Pacificispira spongiicola]
MTTDIVAESDRLILRPWGPDELSVLHGILSHAETMKQWPAPLSDAYIKSWHDWAQELWAERKLGRWALVRKSDGAVIGDCGLVPMELQGSAYTDLGYIVHADHHGQGYGEEAARAILAVGRARADIDPLVIHMAEDHLRSKRVAEKLGFVENFRFVHPENAGKTHIVFTDGLTAIPR